MLLFASSCGDFYTTGQLGLEGWAVDGFGAAAAPEVTTDAGLRTAYGIRFTNASDTVGSKHLLLTLGAAPNTVAPSSPLAIVGTRFRTTTIAHLGGNLIGGQTAHALLSIKKGSTWQIRLQPQTDGALKVFMGGDQQYGGATLLGTTKKKIAADGIYYVWLKVLFSNTVGTIDVMVKSSTERKSRSWLSLKNVDTINSGSSPYWDTIGIGPIHTDASLYHFDYKDVVVKDGSGAWNNDIEVHEACVWYVWPRDDEAAGGNIESGFTASAAGGNADQVADGLAFVGGGHDGDGSYNASTVVGTQDRLLYDQPAAFGKVLAMQRTTVARSPGGGTLQVAGLYHRDADDSNYVGTGKVLTASYLFNREILETNPATGQPWTKAALAPPNQHGYRQTA